LVKFYQSRSLIENWKNTQKDPFRIFPLFQPSLHLVFSNPFAKKVELDKNGKPIVKKAVVTKKVEAKKVTPKPAAKKVEVKKVEVKKAAPKVSQPLGLLMRIECEINFI
jgi:hypothetical protein